jgi:DNA-binding winged helix-turn-helix (wHTH) protein
MIARFGVLTFDSAPRQVTGANGDVLHLTPKAFDLLTLLIEQAPRVVSKAEIHQCLWPDTFVTDTTLVGLVKELRRVLRDDNRVVPIIRTVHRVGYAFCQVERPAQTWHPVTEHWISEGQRRVLLHEGANIIGRDPKSDVWIDLAGVSRRHARVVIGNGKADLEDLGSKNGTMVGAERLTAPRALRDGDAILVGPGRITYRFSESGMSTETTTRSSSRAQPRSR